MTNKLIDRLEELADEMKLIVAQIRKPSTEVSEALANDVIEFEGKQYKKVDREAREGDVVVLNDVGGSHYFETNKPYKVQRDTHINGVGKLSGHKEAHPVYTEFYNRTPETVDVYELIVEDKLLPMITVAGETREITHEEIAKLISEPKTANQLRAEIIEKAKNFVINYSNGEQRVPWKNGEGQWYLQNFDFIINETKRTIVVLCKSIHGGIYERGIAKCDPSDVFNEHIGKAIALGRALGLDVSEFEQVVQPTLAIGQIVKFGNEEARLIPNSETAYHDNGTARVDSFFSVNGTIINDTNAQYGGAE